MKKKVSIVLAATYIGIASHAMNSGLSQPLEIFRQIGDIRSNMSHLDAQQRTIIEQLKQNIETQIQKIAELLEQESVEDAKNQLPTLKNSYKKFEQAVQCIINSQKSSSISHIQSKL